MLIDNHIRPCSKPRILLPDLVSSRANWKEAAETRLILTMRRISKILVFVVLLSCCSIGDASVKFYSSAEEQEDAALFMPFLSVRDQVSCILLPQFENETIFLGVRIRDFEELEEQKILRFAETFTEVSPLDARVVAEMIRRRRKVVLFRQKEAQHFWENPGFSEPFDCVYVKDDCSPVISFAKLSNSGLREDKPPYAYYEKEYSFDILDGERCMTVGQPILTKSFFKKRRPRVLVLDKKLVTDLDFRMIGQWLSPMGKIIIIGQISDEMRENFHSAGFDSLQQGGFLALLPRLNTEEGGTNMNSQGRIGQLANVYVANMDKDYAKRWPMFSASFHNAGLDQVWPKPQRFRAINGKTEAALTSERRALFQTDKFPVQNPYEGHGFRRGVLGCALSHIVLWAKLAKRSDLGDLDAIIILEDDSKFADGITNYWRRGPGHSLVHSDPRWDILMLGFTDHPSYEARIPVWDGVEAFPSRPRSEGGGTYGYMLRKRGAKQLLTLLREFGMPQPVDWFLMEAWARSAIIAYRTTTWIVLQDDKSSQKSNTQEGYPLSESSSCTLSNKAQASPFQMVGHQYPPPYIRTEVSSLEFNADSIKMTSDAKVLNVHPDLGLTTKLKVIHGVDIQKFISSQACAQLCFQYGHSNFSYPPPQCYFLFDNFVSTIYVDPYKVGSSREFQIFAAAFGSDGQMWSNTLTGPFKFRVAPQVAELRLNNLQGQDGESMEIEVEIFNAPFDFMSKHSTSLLCANEHCEPLASLPTTLKVVVASPPNLTTLRITLQTLGDERALAAPLERVLNIAADFVYLRTVLKGVPMLGICNEQIGQN